MADLAQAIIIPQKLIIKWSGLLEDIPVGWIICDGNNGTPNLLAKFIRGAASGQDSGATGGEDNHTLSQAELANHGHSFSESGHGHTSFVTPGGSATSSAFVRIGLAGNVTFTIGSRTSGITIDATGGGGSHENRPQFFELIYLFKT